MPLTDIFGTTIKIVSGSAGNPVLNSYTYDPYGVPTVTGTRDPWPFLFDGMEQEYPDTWKFYYEGNGNFYNPDPFELSLTGAQGLGGAAEGRRAAYFHGNNGANLAKDIFDAAWNALTWSRAYIRVGDSKFYFD